MRSLSSAMAPDERRDVVEISAAVKPNASCRDLQAWRRSCVMADARSNLRVVPL